MFAKLPPGSSIVHSVKTRRAALADPGPAYVSISRVDLHVDVHVDAGLVIVSGHSWPKSEDRNCALGDSRPKGHLQPRVLWFSIFSFVHVLYMLREIKVHVHCVRLDNL